jgi:acyl carrier protein
MTNDDDGLVVRAATARLIGALAPNRREHPEPETLILDELGYDSLRLVEVALWLEEVFETEPGTLEDPHGVKTVGDLQEFILELVREGRAAVPSEEAVARVIRDS